MTRTIAALAIIVLSNVLGTVAGCSTSGCSEPKDPTDATSALVYACETEAFDVHHQGGTEQEVLRAYRECIARGGPKDGGSNVAR